LFSLLHVIKERGRSLLSLAVIIRRVDIVEVLLNFGAQPNLAEEDTLFTPLMYAVYSSSYSAAELLIEHKADVNLSDANGVTPLMIACSLADENIAKLLISKKAILDAVDKNGWTSLHYCAFSGSKECTIALIDEGADRSLCDLNNRRPLHVARYKDHGDVVAILEDYVSKLA